jgi:hypothetical protein
MKYTDIKSTLDKDTILSYGASMLLCLEYDADITEKVQTYDDFACRLQHGSA